MPDGSYSRVEFSPWYVRTFDQNDTVKEAGNVWFANKTGAAATPEEKRAATLAAEHADTPALTLLDSLGRDVISIAHNRLKDAAGALKDEKYITFTKLDAEGKPLWIRDARGNLVMQYITPAKANNDPNDAMPANAVPCYDIAGNLLFQHSMDAGDRWMINDAAGKPMVAWDSRNHSFYTDYDKLHRPVSSFVKGADPVDANKIIQFEKLIYGEGQTDATKHNLRGKPYQHFDTAGVVTIGSYDFKGNPLNSTRQLIKDYKTTPDWSQNPPLETEVFTSSTRYDALNRPIQFVAPHSNQAGAKFNVIRPGYNEANLLERVDVWLEQAAEPTALLIPETANLKAVTNIEYNAKGQRLGITYGNGARTTYDYDDDTFRLINLKTTRPSNADATATILFNDRAILQDLHYTYDPVGNITRIADSAHKTIFCSNQQVDPISDYTYDALYRLTAGSGRERKGAPQYDWDDSGNRIAMPPNGGDALGCYVENYVYDPVGNIMQMIHYAGSHIDQPGTVTWNRRYQYAEDTNQLLGTSRPGDAPNTFSATYTYDPHGNITKMSHLPVMRWDFKDQLQATAKQVDNSGTPETTYYVYDASGQRLRKVTEQQTPAGQTPKKKEERIYLGGFEVFRRYNGNGLKLERETLHIMDDKQRIALVDTKTVDTEAPVVVAESVVRYQLGNHLGSAALECIGSA